MVLLTNRSIPTEGVRHTEKDTTVNVDGTDVGSGTLYIAESQVVWLNPREEGLQFEYRDISLHAISRDLSSFPHQHLLLHYEGKLPGVNESHASSQSEGDGEEEEDMEIRQTDEYEGALIEIRLVPQNNASLQDMFTAMSNCQLLHPDPEDDCKLSDDDEGDDEFNPADEFDDVEEDEGVAGVEQLAGGEGFFTGEEGLLYLSAEGRANLERMNNMIQMGQGDDGDISARTSQITINNGHHNPDDESPEQFQDADGMNE